jgi:hypothetical protein
MLRFFHSSVIWVDITLAHSVRCEGTNGSGLIGRLGGPVRVTFRDKIESLLRGQVILSI